VLNIVGDCHGDWEGVDRTRHRSLIDQGLPESSLRTAVQLARIDETVRLVVGRSGLETGTA
jgi:hypothetical protein